jgi:hypothetical protein
VLACLHTALPVFVSISRFLIVNHRNARAHLADLIFLTAIFFNRCRSFEQNKSYQSCGDKLQIKLIINGFNGLGIVAFWVMESYNLVGGYHRFGGRYCLHLQGTPCSLIDEHICLHRQV